MLASHSLKTSLQRSIVLFSLLLALCLMLLMLGYAWVVEDNVFNRLVTAEAEHISRQYQQTGNVIAPSQPFMTLHAGWQALPGEIQQLRQLAPQRVEFPNGSGGTLHLQTIALGNTDWILAADVTAFEVTRDYLPKLLPYLGLALAVVLAMAFALSRYLSLKIIRPLQAISNRVKQHQPGTALNLDDTLPDNEIGYLGQTIQHNIAQLQAALARETDFTRDISHELRTPATVLKMVLSRLNSSQAPDEQTLTQLTQAALQMEQTIHVLLALAREESMQQQPLCLLEEIEHCLVNNPRLMRQSDLQLQLTVAANYHISANKNLLHILLNNIIDNALNHASANQLEISLNGDELCIANPVATGSPADIHSPGVKGHSSEGIGQGLHLVNRICQGYQWQLNSCIRDNWFYLTIAFTVAHND
ncbi:MAG: HAMP domain-containing histidine kinase [Gammaproteobacteria bacterium]|nr:HAMP domain-containing histidine kinase [Gammaproteobacteria bacterium]MBU1553621.1 HAMP domain-containing histidine kinase [Gammaproteobacteria bacterium]MBU2069268.1 HAMP domain-containing histidine kinase [Gammaproteobacteria bacterium]MBU2183263.1 HAMP domain-containing histidine kinase [Gammaproteobacteria bacterium]MBU2204478.1 HAMP domain-containing histidine kinase [Gammaproteobacteria bacterium]